jgi:serine protease Do
VIEDIQILEAVERYISGQMNPDERVYFEQLRKTHPEIDQMVVEHTFFLQQMNRFDEVRKLKSTLSETHIHLAEKGLISSPRLQGRARVVYLFNRYKRVSAIAASIALITVLSTLAIIQSVSPKKVVSKNDLMALSRNIQTIDQKVGEIQKKNQELDQKINQATTTSEPILYKSGGTGFMVDARGYIATSEHIVQNAKNIAVQGSNGTDLKAIVVHRDPARDIAILQIVDKNFRSPASVPYYIKRSSADIAEPIFTLGYPRNDIVYGEGYLSAKTGYKGDTLSCQITIPANRGNSGSPILNRNGEVIGILSGKQTSAEGAVFAIHSRFIVNAMNELQKDSAHQQIKLPSATQLRGAERQQQVARIADYVFMVKVD